MTDEIEAGVKRCYSTWGDTYFDDYYGPDAPYPPVHVDLVRSLLDSPGIARVIDAGCGPASMLRGLPPDLERYGFDLTPEMVAAAKTVLGDLGVPPTHIWEGSVTDRSSFRGAPYDAAICIGVLPHVPAADDARVIENLHAAVRPGGLVVIEARNELFSLFTLNRYSHRYFEDQLIPIQRMREIAGEDADELEMGIEELQGMFRTDLPPIRGGTQDEPGYDEVLSRTHNPLVLRDQMSELGFEGLQILFYHWHALPPFVGSRVPALQRRASLEIERPDDWRGLVMASAFLIAGTRR